MKFVATLDRDEDGIWISECPAIPGCVSQGSTRDEALANIREAIALCLEVRAERGLPLTIETRQIEVTVWMAILPSLSGREIVKIFQADGWRIARQRGSHIILVKDGHIATLSVPDHREVAKGTLRSLIRASGLTPDEFILLIRKWGMRNCPYDVRLRPIAATPRVGGDTGDRSDVDVFWRGTHGACQRPFLTALDP
jgi:predicted RNase H-like HicB family nuclease/predicted RNA binding protein YcfA (HicA-like mRNA interferase family)